MLGVGRVLDVSLPGCLMQSGEAEGVPPGEYIRLKLYLRDGQSAIDVPLAVVRWVKDDRLLGLEFIRLSEEDAIRLKYFVRPHGQVNAA